MKKYFVIFTFSILLTTGCISSKKSESIRNDLKNAAILDLKSAAEDIKKIAIKDLTNETVEKITAIEEQYSNAIEELQTNNLDSIDNIILATEKYIIEKNRIKEELLERARFYTNILAKIDNGWLSIESLEKMNQILEEEKRRILTDIIYKDMPTILNSFYKEGNIDQDFANIISQYVEFSE